MKTPISRILQNSSKKGWMLGAYSMKIDHLTTCPHSWNSRKPSDSLQHRHSGMQEKIWHSLPLQELYTVHRKNNTNELIIIQAGRLGTQPREGGRKEKIFFWRLTLKGNLLTIQQQGHAAKKLSKFLVLQV